MSLLDVTSSTALDAVGAGVILIDDAGAILLVNREALDMFGRQASDLIGESLEKVLADCQALRGPRDPSERMRALSRQLMELQENERRHIARELHDEIGQSLTAVKLNLETILHLPNKGGAEVHLYDSIAIVEHILQQVRALSLDLRPSLLDDLGLQSALPWYLERQAERAGFTAEFRADLAEAHLAPEIEITCFRVAQEALTNISRHARAKHVWIDLRQRDALLQLVVEDDGVGFDVRQALGGTSLGLVGMRERLLLVGGELTIESSPGDGTRVRAQMPLARALAVGGGTPDGLFQSR